MMKSLKRVVFVVFVLSLALLGSSKEAVSSNCLYNESDPAGGGFSYCVESWCPGTSCYAYDCVYADGRESHYISPGCNVS